MTIPFRLSIIFSGQISSSFSMPSRDIFRLLERHGLGISLEDVALELDRQSPTLTVRIRFSGPLRDLFEALRVVKGDIEEKGRGTQVDHFIMSPLAAFSREVFPPEGLLRRARGAWIQPKLFAESSSEELSGYFSAHGAKRMENGWICIPFSSGEDEGQIDYERCHPSEIPQHFSTHVSGSRAAASAAVGLRIRMTAGSTVADYVERSYRGALTKRGDGSLGGANVVLTTLLQMNDKLSLVNTYCEPLSEDVPLKLLSLPSMRLRVTDDSAETDIAVLVERGYIEVFDIKLGG